MWKNFSFPCMTIVGKLTISPHVEKFQMSPHDRCGEIWNSPHMACVWCRKRRHICKFMQFLRAFMWRKIEPKSTFVEKKMTNMRSDLLLNVWSDFNILFPTDLLDLLGLIGQPLQSREMRIGWEHFLYHIWVSFIVNWPCINKRIKALQYLLW